MSRRSKSVEKNNGISLLSLRVNFKLLIQAISVIIVDNSAK